MEKCNWGVFEAVFAWSGETIACARQVRPIPYSYRLANSRSGYDRLGLVGEILVRAVKRRALRLVDSMSIGNCWCMSMHSTVLLCFIQIDAGEQIFSFSWALDYSWMVRLIVYAQWFGGCRTNHLGRQLQMNSRKNIRLDVAAPCARGWMHDCGWMVSRGHAGGCQRSGRVAG
jgi:hypothetical protein